MKTNINDEYYNIVRDILNNEEFSEMRNIEHHNTTRLDHMMKVSYYSYLITKKLNLNYVKTARGGLLHDFYKERIIEKDKKSEKIKLFATEHPKQAVINAKEQFNLSEIEEDIIRTHMFPIDFKIPRYFESWIVSVVDKFVGAKEFYSKGSKKLKYALTLSAVLIYTAISK